MKKILNIFLEIRARVAYDKQMGQYSSFRKLRDFRVSCLSFKKARSYVELMKVSVKKHEPATAPPKYQFVAAIPNNMRTDVVDITEPPLSMKLTAEEPILKQ